MEHPDPIAEHLMERMRKVVNGQRMARRKFGNTELLTCVEFLNEVDEIITKWEVRTEEDLMPWGGTHMNI
jgi:hypothetical protein